MLSLADAIKHPLYSAVSARVHRYPSSNDWRFEHLCYVRWCAYALEGGVVADYDVFPRVPFPPQEWPGFMNGSLCLDPGFVSGTIANYEAFIQRILTHRPNGHTSDMTIMKANGDLFNRLPLTNNYGAELWDTFPLTHFPNGIMHLAKADLVRTVLSVHSKTS